MIQLEIYQLKDICMQMAELGAANYAKNTGAEKDLISKRQAYKEFSQPLVDEWNAKGLLGTTRSGSAKNSKVLFSRAELIACRTSEDINGYIRTNRIRKSKRTIHNEND